MMRIRLIIPSILPGFYAEQESQKKREKQFFAC